MGPCKRALLGAVKAGTLCMIDCLLECCGADVCESCTHDDLLEAAATFCRTEALTYLLDKGFLDISKTRGRGAHAVCNAIAWYVVRGERVVRFLKAMQQAGADLHGLHKMLPKTVIIDGREVILASLLEAQDGGGSELARKK